MALLAYLVMVAMLMTSVFVGYEWVVTAASPRVAVYSSAPTKVAKQAKLAAASQARLASSKGSESSEAIAAVVVASKEEPVRRKRAKVVARRSYGETSQAALGYTPYTPGVLGYGPAPTLGRFAAFDTAHQ